MFHPAHYRYPHEQGILALTLLLVFLVIVVTATATFCGSAVFVGLMTVMAYYSTRAHHAALMQRAYPVTAESAPGLSRMVQAASQRLGVEPVAVYVVSSRSLNAYTFGLTAPKVVVLNSALLEVLDADETFFVVSHELGHVRLGHTWLNSLVGGLSGIPSPAAAFALLHLAFLWWNRACEHSADRAGLLATGRLDKAISALLKIGLGGQVRHPADLQRALQAIESPAASAGWGDDLAEALGTHPRLARRIAELRAFAASPEYARLMRAHASAT